MRYRTAEVDWDAVLGRLPKTSTSADASKRPPQVFEAPEGSGDGLARWSPGKQTKKVADGKYRKVG